LKTLKNRCNSSDSTKTLQELKAVIQFWRTKIIYFVGFEVFTAVVMTSIIFWDMTPCSPSSFNRCFGGTYRLRLQGQRNKFKKTS
jgi:hypothetical protein